MGGGLVLVLVNGDSARVACWPVGSSHPDEDKHKAPSSTPPHPLSLQDGLRLLLHSVVTIHKDAELARPSLDLPHSFRISYY